MFSNADDDCEKREILTQMSSINSDALKHILTTASFRRVLCSVLPSPSPSGLGEGAQIGLAGEEDTQFNAKIGVTAEIWGSPLNRLGYNTGPLSSTEHNSEICLNRTMRRNLVVFVL